MASTTSQLRKKLLNALLVDVGGTDESPVSSSENVTPNTTPDISTTSTVICAINAVDIAFSASALRKGHAGGQEITRKLAVCIRNSDYLDNGVHFRLNVFILFSKDTSVTDDFVLGLNKAEDAVYAVNIGDDEDLAIARILDISAQALISDTVMKFIVGGHGVDQVLLDYDQDLLDKKVMILRGLGSSPLPEALRSFESIKVPPLFEAKNVNTPAEAALSPTSPDALYRNHSLVPSVTSPLSIDRPLARSLDTEQTSTQGTEEQKYLDPNVPTFKHNPPPCNMHYLLGRCLNLLCLCGHDYVLREGDKERMKEACKMRPCDSVTKGTHCRFVNRCLYGHYCPNGPGCVLLADERCDFGGEDRHKTPADAETYTSLFFTRARGSSENWRSKSDEAPPTSWRSARSPSMSSPSPTESTKTALYLDPAKYINDHDPRPCPPFYLRGHCGWSPCKWSHDYTLHEGDKERIAVSAKYAPCVFHLKRKCTQGTACIFGHVCPWKGDCRYLKEGTCCFGGEAEHIEIE